MYILFFWKFEILLIYDVFVDMGELFGIMENFYVNMLKLIKKM